MILIALLVLACVSAVVAKHFLDDYNETAGIISAAFCTVFITCLFFVGIVAIIAHIPLNVRNSRLKYEQRYQTITDVIQRDEKNSIVIAGEIADYNAEVMQGRNKMHDPWIGIMQYQFWDELPLIEYSNSSEIEN